MLAVFVGCATTPDDEAFTVRETDDTTPPPEHTGMSKERKALILNVGIAAGVAAYGFRFWDYGGVKFQTKNEGWFGEHTQYGGADKLGHMYSTYLATLGFASLYERWGYERRKADLYGALSAMGMFTLIEVGDGVSRYGFSFEDLTIDAVGAAFGYLRRRHPRIGDFVDLRVEYWPSRLVTEGGRTDLTTDYSGFKYIAALKLAGFRRLEDTPLQYIEILGGYYTRGYGPSAGDYYDRTSRTLFVGLGLNFSQIFKRVGWKKTAKVFNFYQVPYTFIESGGLE